MKRWIRCVMFLTVGVAVGAYVESLRERPGRSVPEHKWAAFLQHHEPGSHHRIMAFQKALSGMRGPESRDSVEALSKDLETQLKIEDLIIRSRESEHKVTVYGWLIGPIIAAAVGAVMSLIVAGLRTRKDSAG